ncbi:MAG: phosphoribosyltransferase [Legionellales bacterium]
MKYIDRYQAGRVLAELLKNYAHRSDVIVLALPRGGVPVAYEITAKLSLALDILVVRKLGAPGHKELAIGAIASGGITVLNQSIVQAFNIDESVIDDVARAERKELMRREFLYRGTHSVPDLNGKTIILVDDGMATGSTMKAAILAMKQKNTADIIVAVPVAARATCKELSSLVKKIICPLQLDSFYAVGMWYDDFSQTTDEEVVALLKQ